MNTEKKQVVIIGGGPAGLAAAVALHDLGVKDLLIVEREKHLGGILRQCIHDGFGLTRFKESLSGPEYARRFIDEVEKRNISYITETTVIELTEDRIVRAASKKGLLTWQADAVVLSMGCRERTRGALQIPGERPGGVYTAGVAQSYINLYNTMVGKKVVILGSGDIGLIMARRLTLEGAKVEGVYEILPYPSGLERNVEQCLNDFGIPLHLSHTVTKIHGGRRVEGVTISQVDQERNPIPGKETYIPCDTLVLSVGLIPENELSKMAKVELDSRTNGPRVDASYQTSTPGIFAAGNVLHVHDLVDYVSMEAERLAKGVVDHLKGATSKESCIPVLAGEGITYVLPQQIGDDQEPLLSMRVQRPAENIAVVVRQGEKELARLELEEALPAEMIQILLDPEKIKSDQPMEVYVR
ncbi:FAD-dependent oxidoreductase [Alkalibacter rhizosphaerae]|uniref:FAD-dependent oxidoreductase n=1 Tax=Alkalibacter rhizosphaerae TaxID=2815577 RepID=A0A974XIA5_9FIRM|nr:FAD-dependent oxidoreductase [Alkalibacter rhizosphaerae]QSX09200.1 FAD-dependent oxidoreductase [Alkalibacter rhizosphaerae]